MYQNALTPSIDVADLTTPGSATLADRPRIMWDRFRLANGLTVIVHENRRSPMVTVNVWYKVGAKDEKPGKTGLAHLFEHLMFGGSRNMPGSYLANMGQIGTVDLNGTTNTDRTNFFQTVPTGALDVALFAESDRMGHFIDALSAETLEQQRGVVLNEKRQNEGAPYGMVGPCIQAGMFPPGHPYAHTTIGEQEDVERLTLDDARHWFRSYYGPSNAILVLAGDIDVATAREKVQTYFGDIPPSPPVRHLAQWVAAGQQPRREVLEDRVPNARVILAWNAPSIGDMDATRLSMVAPILGVGMTSWLHRRLVEDLRIATDAGVSFGAMMLAGQFIVAATLPQNGDIDGVEAELKAVVARFLAEGPSQDELERTKMQAEVNLIRNLERTSAVADVLAMNEMFFGDPDYFQGEMERLACVTTDDLRDAATRWLSDTPAYTLHVLPRPAFAADGAPIDRSEPPMMDAPAGIAIEIAEGRLSNGMRVLVAERPELPLVDCKLLFPRGATLEPRDRMGLAQITTGLMTRGAGDRDADAFMHVLQQNAIGFGVGSNLDHSGIGVSALRSKLDLALDLQADVAMRPRFEAGELERLRRMRIEALNGVYASPAAAVGREMAGLMYGQGHPYARLSEGLPTTLAAIEQGDIRAFHAAAFDPAGATIIVAGDTSLAEMIEKLEARYGGWTAASTSVATEPAPSVTTSAPGVYFIDRPGASQTSIAAALVIPPHHGVDPIALKAVDMVLGGSFDSRLNMNLRERRNWTYGARTEIGGGLQHRLLAATVPVQADKTAESMAEILKEYRDLIGERPIDAPMLGMVKQSIVLGLPGRCRTIGDLIGTMEALVQLDLPLDYWSGYAERVEALDLDFVNAVARQILHPERLVWVVSGDRALVEDDIRRLDLGSFQVMKSGDDLLYR